MTVEKSVKLAMIVAQSSNRVIGIENRLPWYLPEDLKYFKSVTMGKPIIMGRKTFESIGRPLPGRKNVVITRQSNWSAPGVTVVYSVSEALAVARVEAQAQGVDCVVVIGGAQIYAEALPLADELFVTEVAVELEGDAYFPELDSVRWCETSRSETLRAEMEGAEIGYTFVTYQRSSLV